MLFSSRFAAVKGRTAPTMPARVKKKVTPANARNARTGVRRSGRRLRQTRRCVLFDIGHRHRTQCTHIQHSRGK